MYGKPVIRKPQLEKEEFRLREERPNLPAHLKNRGFYYFGSAEGHEYPVL
jgi:hypothetical protein